MLFSTFNKLKNVTCSCLVFAVPNFSLSFVLAYDASSEGIGAVLLQQQHFIAFESRKLIEEKRKISIYFREMLSIMHALVKFRQYLPLYGKFVVKTDHNNLKYFLNQKDLTNKQHKWISMLQAYDFDIEYVKARHNVVVDASSPRPSLCVIFDISANLVTNIKFEYAKIDFTTKLLDGRAQMIENGG